MTFCHLEFKGPYGSRLLIILALPVKGHDFQVNNRFNNVLVTVTNAAFPLIDSLTPEERQARAEKDELSTKELPIMFIDNTTAATKIAEVARQITGPYADQAVQREDCRVQVSPNNSSTVHETSFSSS